MSAHLEHRRAGLEDLRDQIFAGHLRLAYLPESQRSLVWPPDLVGALLQSIQQHHPIGSLLVWRTHEVTPVVESLFGRKLEAPATRSRSYLIDGRSRVASLLYALTYSGEGARWYYDLATREFVYSAVPAQSCLPLHILLDLKQLTAWLGKLQVEEWADRGYRLNHLFAHYPLVVTELSDISSSEVKMMLGSHYH